MGEIERIVLIPVSSLLGTLADHISTKIALGYPELREANPVANFPNEFLFSAVGGTAIYGLGRLLGQSEEVSLVFGLIPSGVSWVVAVNNLAWTVYAHRNVYPWEEMPWLYPETE